MLIKLNTKLGWTAQLDYAMRFKDIHKEGEREGKNGF